MMKALSLGEVSIWSRKVLLAVRSSSITSRWRAAGVDEQAEGEGKVLVHVEVADGLRFAVDLEDEVVLGEVLDEGSFFVADDDREIDEAGVYRRGWEPSR